MNYSDEVVEIPDLDMRILTCGNCQNDTFYIGAEGSVMCSDCRCIMHPAPKRIYVEDDTL